MGEQRQVAVGWCRSLTLLGAAVALVAGGVGAAPAALGVSPHDTPIAESTVLSSGVTAVTSSTKHKLYTLLSATQTGVVTAVPGEPASGGTDGLDITLTDSSKLTDGGETHDWSFRLPSGSLTINSDDSGTLDVPSSVISPYGSASLTFSPKGSPDVQQCGGQPYTSTQPVTLSGTFYFNSNSTGSHKWGTVGSETKTFAFAATSDVTTTYLTTDYDCTTIPQGACTSSLSWESDGADVTLDGSGAGKSDSYVTGDRTVNLSTPTGATRTDFAQGTAKPLSLTTKGKTVSLSVVGLHKVTGSAALSSKKLDGTFSNPCKTGTERIKTWEDGGYKNGKSPLKVSEQIFGALTVSDNKKASITAITK